MSSVSDSTSNDGVLVGPEDIGDFNSGSILPLPAEDLVKIRQWLQPTPYDVERSEYSRHRASYLMGTGKWLTSTKTYQQWHSGENGLLWIKGIPGSGKSVMAASIINQLRNEEVPIIDANHKPITALCDWLCQVLDYNPPLQVKLKEYIDNRRSIDSLSLSGLWKDLKLALESFPKAYCITDALDEIDERNDGFLHSLVELGQWRPSNVKVLVTSRPVTSVETSLRTFTIPQIRLEERLVDLDIAANVQHKLRNSSIPKVHWNIIEKAIPGRANGLFLYAKLSMDAFLEQGADVHEVLKALPADLNVMYNGLLREHAKRSKISDEIQLLVLQFVTHATRPLRLLEIAEVMNTVHFSSGNPSLKETKELVRATCGPLLEILPDETVSVVHHSFTEFLKGLARSGDSNDSAYPVLHPGPTNKCLAVACLDYLRSGCLDNQRVKKRSKSYEFYHFEKEGQSELWLNFPFLEYAAKNWFKHTRRAASEGADMSHVYHLVDTFFAEKHRYNIWLDIAWPTSSIRDVTPLHVAAWAGLAQYTAHLLQTGDISIEARDCNHNTPLYWAVYQGHMESVQVLLDNGVDPDTEQGQGLRPLHVAAGNNHADIVEVLLAAGVDPLTSKTGNTPGDWCTNGPSSYGDPPLMYACHNGHVKTVTQLLPFLKDIEPLHHALGWAADKGHAEIVDLILHYPGVDVNAMWKGDTTLFRACKIGDLKTIDVLLTAGADPNIFCANVTDECIRKSYNPFKRKLRPRQEPRGFTALHSLCKNDKYWNSIPLECAEVLLKAGADVHVKTPDGSTALHYACKYSVNLIKPLLEAGADPVAENDAGETPLHTDGETDADLLPLLLGTGIVDINRPRSTDGKTPLLCRLETRFSKQDLPLFLGYRPDVHATDAEGNGALHVALKYQYIEISVVEALLSAGADPNLKNRHGNTPFHVMEYGIDIAVISRLLDVGADLEARNNAGETVLFARLTSSGRGRKGKPELFQTLINQGARTNTRDYKGRTLWHRGCGESKCLDYLTSLGLDPTVTDYEGNTPLHEVATRAEPRRIELQPMKHLMRLGLEVDQPNHRGRTVLHILCSKTDDESESSKKGQPFDYVLGVSKNVNPSDINGIQPLHLAATICESFVFKLLNARADLFAVTHEHMTVLHLAARARQSGIVDMILSQLGILEAKDRMAFVNQKNREGEAALHYACRSGRPETVKSLLEAGADPNLLDNSQNSPFIMCARFENEQQLWYNSQQQSRAFLNAAGLFLEDRTRPFQSRNCGAGRHGSMGLETEHDTTRLVEIMGSLVQYGAVITGDCGCLQMAWQAAKLSQFGYTIDCILLLEARLTDTKTTSSFHCAKDFRIATYCRGAVKEALKESAGPEDGEEWSENRASFAQRDLLQSALAMRQYDLFEEIATNSVCLVVPDSQGRALLNDLVRWGYIDILARVCTRELATKLDGHEWCHEAAKGLSRNFLSPLIVSACERGLPNMDVLKQLVEDFGVSMDAQNIQYMYRDGGNRIQTMKGALHYLATGSFWWYVDGALPYLIQRGANLELRDNYGTTPLHIALRSTKPFSKEAAKILIRGGADVNAVDYNGNTCLSKADDDLDLIKILIAHGAQVSAVAIFSAIKNGQVAILEALLSQGNYANIRSVDPRKPTYESSNSSTMIDSEILPLFYASSYQCHKTPDLKATKARMMTILLKHGADPFADFAEYTRPRRDNMLTGEPAPGSTAKRNTIIHKTLSLGHVVEPFFQMPSLDVERRDQSGCTLLLAASKNHNTLGTRILPAQEQDTSKTVFQELIDRGANVMAQENDGKTILHLIGALKREADFVETLKTVLINNPSLVHQTDRAGHTPLHCALRQHAYDYVDLLLENGANPTHPDSNGDTALHHIASSLTDRPLFMRFLHAGVDINARNNKGDTSLFKYIEIEFGSSCRRGIHSFSSGSPSDGEFNDPVFKFFRKAGADFFARNNAQSSLLHLLAAIKPHYKLAREESLIGIVKWFQHLMNLGLDPMAEDARQRTSLDVAAACGSEHIQKLFERKPVA